MLKFVAAALMLASIAGCQKSADDPVVKISGEVTLDKQAFEDAFVVFVPRQYRNAGFKVNPIAYGKTDESGRFELQAGEIKGVQPGTHRVLIFGKDAGGQHRQSIADLNDLFKNNPLPVVAVAGRSTEGSVPRKFNLESELEFEVSDMEAMHPTFELNSD